MKNCLNCGEQVENKYCSHCGQPTTTHRFSLKHFFSHDIVHGAFHLDHGFPNTIVSLFTSAGSGVREFVQGKRIKYFNFVTLLLVLIGFSHFLEQYTLVDIQDVMGQELVPQNSNKDVTENINQLNTGMFNIMQEYPKATILSLIPFYALISLIVFKKAKQNYTEHLVLTSYKMSGLVLIGFIDVFARLATDNISFLKNLYFVAMILGYGYTIWFMFTYFKPFYKKKIVVIRKSVFYTLHEFLFQIIIGALTAGIYFAIKMGSFG